MLVTMLPLRVVSWQGLLAGLVIFRVLDVLKPWPIRRLEALPDGWGSSWMMSRPGWWARR